MIEYRVENWKVNRAALNDLATLVSELPSDALACKHIACSSCCLNAPCLLSTNRRADLRPETLTQEQLQVLVNLVLFGNFPYVQEE